METLHSAALEIVFIVNINNRLKLITWLLQSIFLLEGKELVAIKFLCLDLNIYLSTLWVQMDYDMCCCSLLR